MNEYIRKYGLLQIALVAIFCLYTFGMTFGTIYFLESLTPTPSSSQYVTINLIIQSNHTDYPINYSHTNQIPINRSLLDHINLTLGRENWSGENYGVYGWFINRLFNASESEGWNWLYYYRESGTTTWRYSPVGVSKFILNRDLDIKFVFQHS